MNGSIVQRCFLVSVFIALSASGFHAARAQEADRPNLLVILVDDLGVGDLACYGAKDLRTPAIDRLASRGVRLENFYANCPVCSPTRAALLSGRYPEMVGVPGVVRTHARDNWGKLVANAKLLPELLSGAGYHTAIVGKWHLGLEKPDRPHDRGFDLFHGFLGDMMDDYYNHRRHGNNYMRRNDEVIDPPGHATDLFTDWAIDYLESRKAARDPFFLYLSYNAPHTPIQPPEDWISKVKEREPEMNPKRVKLAALIEHLDHGIGRVLAALDSTGLANKTLVVFTSDNGGQVNVGANNGPWRAGKGTVYEGGIRVAFVASWPGRIAPGTTSSHVGLTMDLYPTLLEAAGVKVSHAIDGVSFLGALRGQSRSAPERDLFFARREGGVGFGGKTIEALRSGDWKLLQNSPYAALELYNLADDPREANDLRTKRPKVFRDLAAKLRRQIQRYGSVPWQRGED